MQTSPSVDSVSVAHHRRIMKLSEKLALKLRSPAEDVFDVCEAFDQTVEFAALEGLSVVEAIAAFLEEGVGVGWAVECAALARLSGYGSGGIDVHASSLPVLPEQAARLLRTSAEDTSHSELENIAGSDPVLAGKLLDAANSPRFGSQCKIVRLQDAIMRLGISEARKVLLASSVGGLFASEPLQDLWEHSQTVARTASALAPLVGMNAETAYVGGLLHDIGRLAFMQLPAELRVREQEWFAAGFPIVYAETLTYGVDHAALGAHLLRAWELPEQIVEAVSLHNRPERSGLGLSAIISLADDPTAQAEYTAREDLWPRMRRAAACAKTGITPEQLEEFADTRRPLPQVSRHLRF